MHPLPGADVPSASQDIQDVSPEVGPPAGGARSPAGRYALSLAAWFWLISGALFLMAFVVVLRLTFIDWMELRRADRAVALVEQLRLGLRAVEMASRERGPTNGVLGAEAPTPAPLRASLDEARARTDQAYAAFLQALQQSPRQDGARDSIKVDGFELALRQARREVDALVARPLAEREPRAIRARVEGMIRLIPMLRPSIMRLTDDIQQNMPTLSSTVVGALLAAELRETAGQLGSLLTPALSRQTPLTEDERLAIEHMRGRIAQLHTLLAARVQLGGQAAAERAQARLEHDYFGRADVLVRRMFEIGRHDGHYGLSTAEFAARYVPDMNPILELRDILLDAAHWKGEAFRREQRRDTAVMLGMTGAHIMLIVLALNLVHRRVIQPLGQAAEALEAMKSDRCVPLTVPDRGDEISAVIGGIAALQVQSRRRGELEAERDKLIERLRVQSSTDFLTSLPNRRAFFEAAEAEIARARRHGFGLVLLLLDVDHFKRINDGMGHGAGDLALVSISTVLRQSMRQGDIAARIGGEEFVVLLSHCEREDGLRFAQRLRQSVAAMAVDIGAGLPPLRMTVSIGLADSEAHGLELDVLMKRADQAMYRAKAGGRDRIEVAEAAD